MESNELILIEEDLTISFSRVYSCGINGIHAFPIEIEVDISSGVPNFILVGLPDTAVNESKERVRSAIKSSSYEFPSKKIVVNLAPADTKKAGPNYDLPIAIGILSAQEKIHKKEFLEKFIIIGELGLSGVIRKVNGVLSSAILAKKRNFFGLIIPRENSDEASLIEGINIYPVSSLTETVDVINNHEKILPLKRSQINHKENLDHSLLDFSNVKGQLLAKKGLEISASGGHHVLMIGSPGSGKTMLAQRLTSILPELSQEERIEVTQVYSSAGKLKEKNLIYERPFRNPHHSISSPGLIGGGPNPQPGEISLAHHGILFLDEFTEFQRNVIDSLRQALEAKEITISRSKKSLSFPCDFTLITACNPCPCGYLGDKIKNCVCNVNQIKKYLTKISGPILDRIDIQCEVNRLNENEMLNTKNNSCEKYSSEEIKKRVIEVREIQKNRFKNKHYFLNSHIPSSEINKFCPTEASTNSLIREAIKNYSLTARGYDRLLRVSRTIADLNKSEKIKDEHVLEALQYRIKSFYSLT